MNLKQELNLQLFADAGTLVNASGNYVNAYSGETSAFPDGGGMTASMKTFYDTELLENAVTADLYYEVLGAYYDAYGAQAGEIYIKLIQTRRELAGRLGYGSYADYAYDALYYRDYTPAQAERYVERVRTELAPVYTEAADAAFRPFRRRDDAAPA